VEAFTFCGHSGLNWRWRCDAISVVVEVVFVLDVLVINVLDDVDDDFVVVVVVTKVEEATEEEVVLDDGGFWFNVDSGMKLICTQ
jgi:hypothetical protein